GGKQPADGHFVARRWVAAQILPVLAEHLLQARESHAGLDGDGEVLRLVLHDAVQGGGVERDVVRLARAAQRGLRTCAERCDRESGTVAGQEQRGGFLARLRCERQAGGDAIESVGLGTPRVVRREGG